MPKGPVTFDTVRKVGLTLPGVEDRSTGKTAALKVDGKLLAWIPTNRAAEPDSFAIRIDDDNRDELVAAAPDIYYVPGHYVNWSTVLVRMSRVNPDALRDLLGMALKFVTRESKPPSRERKPRKSGSGSV